MPLIGRPHVVPTPGSMVSAFTSLTAVLYVRGVRQRGWPPIHERVWQRNPYDRIICDEESLNRIRQHIFTNPLCWAYDRDNPA